MSALESRKNPNHSRQYIQSSFRLHVFKTCLTEKTIVYQVIKMADSVFICINYEDNLTMTDMSLAMQNPYEKLPIATQLLGDSPESVSKNMAAKLSRKFNKCVYISFNVECDKRTLPFVEKRLFDEIKSVPDCF